jgi:DNA transposition AAA+ family ATPase
MKEDSVELAGAGKLERPIYPCDEKLRAELMTLRNLPGGEWNNGSIASEVGFSAAAISEYLNAKGNRWKNVAQLETNLRAFLRNTRLQLDTSIETIQCDIAEQITGAVEEIRTAKRAGAIIGAPGIGKSRGIDVCCQQNPLAIAFRVCAWMKAQSDFASCLFAAADVGQARRGLAGMSLLAEKLKGSSRPVLVDDAHKATRAALQLGFDFRDATGIPLVLFGDERLIAKLKDDPQRLRRTGLVFRLKIKEPLTLIKHHIAALCGDLEGEGREMLALCRQVVDNAGHFGSLQMELSLAARIKQALPELSWCECVRRAHRKLIREYSLNQN